MATEVLMPQLGQAMETGVVVAWHVGDGEEVGEGAPLLTIEADKAAFDIEAPASGRLRHHVEAGAEAEIGAVLATIGESAVAEPPSSPPVADAPASHAAPSPTPPRQASTLLASPRARAAADGRIDLAEVVPANPDGVITAADVEQAIARRTAAGAAAPVVGAGRREALSASRRSAIRRLQQSWTQAPHIVQMIEVDATQLVAAIELRRVGATRATLNDIVIKAAADSMAEFADLNAHIDGDEIVYADRVDVCIAVATERGLRTPLIAGAAGLSLEEVADRRQDAVEAAHAGRAAGGRGSLTISNLGSYGIRCGTPVLNLDETVLVFVGEIAERAVVTAGAIMARPEMTLSIAFDHRVVDGLRAAEFSAALRRRLEAPGGLSPRAAAGPG